MVAVCVVVPVVVGAVMVVSGMFFAVVVIGAVVVVFGVIVPVMIGAVEIVSGVFFAVVVIGAVVVVPVVIVPVVIGGVMIVLCLGAVLRVARRVVTLAAADEHESGADEQGESEPLCERNHGKILVGSSGFEMQRNRLASGKPALRAEHPIRIYPQSDCKALEDSGGIV